MKGVGLDFDNVRHLMRQRFMATPVFPHAIYPAITALKRNASED